MQTSEWLEARKSGIGGSDVAAVLGFSPWTSPLDVYLDKTGRAAPQEENDAMYWGTRLEALVADKYTEETGLEVRRVNSVLRSEKFPMMLGNIDRAVCVEKGKMPVVNGEFRTPKFLECKTARRKDDNWGIAGTDQVPEWYITQVLHYLGLTKCKSADLAVLFLESRKFEIYKIEADQDLIARMWERLADWWEAHVVKDVPPPPRSMSDLAKLFPKSVSAEIVASADIEELVKVYSEISAKAKIAKVELEKAKENIALFMGGNDTLLGVDGKPLATFKSRRDSLKTDWEAIAKELGANEEMISKHTRAVAGARTFLSKIKIKSEEKELEI